MARELSKKELIQHKNQAIKKLDNYLSDLINNSNPKVQSKADKLSYWLEDWTTFLDYEPCFSASNLRRYKRGEIIKAHLGYNVGSEEGGLHYCVVIDKNNSKNSPVVTVVPLTSVKEKTDIEHLHKGNVYLGNEIFRNLNSKISLLNKRLSDTFDELEAAIESVPSNEISESTRMIEISKKLDSVSKEMNLLSRMQTEVMKMKIGSIALICQMRTISKIRIYDPKTNFDVLSNVKLSNEKLDLIDAEILKHYTGQK